MSICEYANMAREKKKTEETIIKRSPAERERERVQTLTNFYS
jgi:hypothetical protein